MTEDASLEATIHSLPTPVDANVQPFHHLRSNVYISRTIEGAAQIVLVNAPLPSEALNLRNGTLESNISFNNQELVLENCLVLEFSLDVDAYAVAKVAEHLTRGNETIVFTGNHLLESLDTFRNLVETENIGWGFKRIVSLWGEFALLERLLSYADTPVKQLRCVQAWQSFSIHCMDFSLPNQPPSMEMKTTAQQTRTHEISSVDQMTNPDNECIYLASLMIRPVGQGEGWSVMDIVDRIRGNLCGDAHALFQECLDILQINEFACSNDWFVERNNRPLRLFHAHDVPGVSQFTPLPEGVPSLSWPVLLPEQGIADDELDTLFTDWLSVYDEEVLC